jgi:hypothetical protein
MLYSLQVVGGSRDRAILRAKACGWAVAWMHGSILAWPKLEVAVLCQFVRKWGVENQKTAEAPKWTLKKHSPPGNILYVG